MLCSRWGPGAGRKGSQAWCQSAVPTHPGWREFSGSVICSRRTCLCFCNFYFLLSKAEGKPKEIKFLSEMPGYLCCMKRHMKRESTFCGSFWRKKRGQRAVVAREGYGKPHPLGKRQTGMGREKRGFFSAQDESRGSLSALTIENHTDKNVNPSPTTV